MSYAVLLTTCGDKEAAKSMAHALVESRLAACVQMLPIDSVCEWQGRVEETSEVLLVGKIKRADYPEVEALVRALHSYETPEVVMLPIEAGSAAYLAWIDSVTK